MQMRTLGMIFLAAGVQVTAGSVLAAEAWLCSVAAAVSVDEDGTVGPPELGERERPTFLRVDPVKKELTLLAPASRRGEVTKLDSVHEVDGTWILSGVEHGRSVSMVITGEGRMTLSVVADGVVWSVFGHALRESDAAQPVEAKKAVVAPGSETAAEPSRQPAGRAGCECHDWRAAVSHPL